LFRDRFDPNIWIKATFKTILDDQKNDWAISDCRFINEAMAVRNHGGTLVKLVRNNASEINGVQNHRSENDLDNFHDWDYILENNGSHHDFFRKLDNLMEILGVC
jgi:hypothetical protein